MLGNDAMLSDDGVEDEVDFGHYVIPCDDIIPKDNA
jgi:hypothetical protein